MSGIKLIDVARVRAWRKQWLELSSRRFHNDYRVAELAAEIRKEFPKDDSGSIQYIRFIRRNMKGTNGGVMARKAAAFLHFSEEEWGRLGGWAGISFLSALRRAERCRVIASLSGKGPYHYSTIRAHALKLKIVSRQKGRDTRSRAEERVQKLQEWILSLYRNKSIKNLPPVPRDVEEVLTRRTLVSLTGMANALQRPSA
jgi:hypothetical protein